MGLIDLSLPHLPIEYASLVDEVSASVNPTINSEPALFLDGSPMTHDVRFTLRFQNHPGFFRAAVVYDFIPLDWPGYLTTIASRMDYCSLLANLKKFDAYFPISGYTASRLRALVNVGCKEVTITGASIRNSLFRYSSRPSTLSLPYQLAEPYFVVLGGEDRRKNLEVATKAVRNLNLLHRKRIPLKVVGCYGDDYKRQMLDLAGHCITGGFLEFYSALSDEQLAALFSQAIATIVPSLIEGFSLPVVEAAIYGCPAVVSTCRAHLELVDQPEALFHPMDVDALTGKLDALLRLPSLRTSLVSAQCGLPQKFHEREVGRRFWNSIERQVHRCSAGAVAVRKRKPRIAFLSPFPPDKSGCA